MVKIPPFDVEQWMDKYETTPGVLNIAETCCASVSVDDLRGFNKREDAPQPLDLSRKMTYGVILGSAELRQNITNLYRTEGDVEGISNSSVVVTQGAIAANHLVFYSLVGPGDHVISVFPTYQQLYAVPESLGAEVSLWRLKAEDEFVPDVQTLRELIKSNTKMIVINNPNNPTGAVIPIETLKKIAEVAREHDIILFSDEVYRPLFHSVEADKIPPSALSLGWDKTVVTSSMSKAWALAGIRLGWVASRDSSIIEKVAVARDYTTISVSQLDDQVARYALSDDVRPQLIERNINLARRNLALLDQFVQNHSDVVSWVKPTAGTTAFIQFRKAGQPVEDEHFCLDVLNETKVMFLPGRKCFGHGKGFEGSSDSQDAEPPNVPELLHYQNIGNDWKRPQTTTQLAGSGCSRDIVHPAASAGRTTMAQHDPLKTLQRSAFPQTSLKDPTKHTTRNKTPRKSMLRVALHKCADPVRLSCQVVPPDVSLAVACLPGPRAPVWPDFADAAGHTFRISPDAFCKRRSAANSGMKKPSEKEHRRRTPVCYGLYKISFAYDAQDVVCLSTISSINISIDISFQHQSTKNYTKKDMSAPLSRAAGQLMAKRLFSSTARTNSVHASASSELRALFKKSTTESQPTDWGRILRARGSTAVLYFSGMATVLGWPLAAAWALDGKMGSGIF
ncbi:aspartate aminotransferase [Seiridium cupressi]